MNDDQFPDGFLWGTATSAYQVEGGITNDWEIDPRVPKAGRAADHWNRWEEDLDMAVALNTNAYRFSVEWARVEPKEGEFDDGALAQYRAMVRGMRARGLEPFVTLHHFTHPTWFGSDGWLRDDAIDVFGRFVERVVQVLGDDVQYWCTINEPLIYVGLAHVRNDFPARSGRWLAYRVARRLQEAHKRAYRLIKENDPSAHAGIVKHNRPVYATGLHRLVRPIADWAWNHWFLRGVQATTDFIGLNYYRPSVIGDRDHPVEHAPRTDMGWAVWPQGLLETLMALKRYDTPIYITENGLADQDDVLRAAFIVQHLHTLHRAVDDGVDVQGYFYWSLLDNFEWAHGFGPRFGLYAVDYDSLERTKRPSADVYAAICEQNAVPNALLKQHTLT